MIYNNEFRREVDVGIITIVPTEIEALFDAFSITRDQYESAGSPLQYWRTDYPSSSSGRVLSVTICILGAEAGNVEAAIATTQFLHDWYPRLMCLVGIAAGIGGKVRVGDVVMPNRVHDRCIKVYENGNLTVRGRTYGRNDTIDRMLKVSPVPIKGFLESLAQTAHEDIRRGRIVAKRKGLIPDGFDTKPRIMNGSIASDNLLIRDPTYFQGLLDTTDEKCRGAEMEAAGFVLACQREQIDFPWIVFRGISDFGSHKDDAFQLLAAKSACAALRTFIQSSLSIDVLPANARARRASIFRDTSLIGQLRTAFAAGRWNEVCRIGSTISRTLWLSGHMELRYEIGTMVESSAAYSDRVSLRARTLIDDLGWGAFMLGKKELALKHINDGVRLGVECADNYVVAKGYRHLASVCRRTGDLRLAAKHLAKAKKVAVSISDEDERVEIENSLYLSEAELEIARKGYSKAISLLIGARDAFRRSGDIEREAKVYARMAYCQQELGDSGEAERLYLEGRALAREAGRFDVFANSTRSLLGILGKDQPRCNAIIQEVYEFAISNGLWDEARIWQKQFRSSDISVKIGKETTT